MRMGLLLLAAPVLAAQTDAIVEGVAINKVTRAGVPGVVVKLAATARGKELYQARSDASGAFRIEGVAEGTYFPSFEAPNGFMAPGLWEPASKPFSISATSRAVRLEAPIVPLGKLRGRVLDPDGHPVPRVRVEIFRVYGASGHFLTTDNEGRFHEEGIVPGAYRIRARPVLDGTPLARREKNVSALPAQPPQGQIWAPTYFPNAIEISGAQSVFVREGADLDGFDIRLRAAPAYRLRGVVLDDQGKPAAGATVWLHSEIGWGTAEAEAKSGPEGRFEFPAVRAGDWRLSAEATRDKIKWTGYGALTMPKRDFESAEIRISPPFPLEGVVEGLPRAGRSPVSAHFYPLDDEQRGHSALEQPNGSLHFEDVYPGRYRADLWSRAPGFYLKSILLGTRDITGIDVDLVAGSPPVRFIFQPNAARARGEVQDGAGVKVVFIDADPEVFVLGQAIRVEVCDAEGHFTVDGLHPGAWYAFAFATHDNMNTDAIRDAVFVRGLARQADPIHLQEGEMATLKLKISPWPE